MHQSRHPQPQPRDDEEPATVPKTRQCLKCHSQFESTWSGERICRRCKGTAAWRQGQSGPAPRSWSRG